MTELWLVRHGKPVVEPGRCLGWTDVALADPDQTTAAMIALARRWSTVSGVHSSDLRRARDTAMPLAGALDVEVRFTAELREMSFGAWEGLTWAEIEQRDPAGFARYMADWSHERPPAGESVTDVVVRVRSFLASLADVSGVHVVVGHSGSLRLLAAELLGWTAADALEKPLGYGHMCGIDVCERRVIAWNE